MTYKFTVFIGGTADANNYSRTVSGGPSTRVSELVVRKPTVNNPPTFELKLAGASTSDTNLVVVKSGVRNTVYVYAGTAGSTSDTLVYRFRIDDITFKSDGYCMIKGKQWMGSSSGVQLDELTTEENYKGKLSEMLAELLPTVGENAAADAIDTSGISSDINASFKADRNWTRQDGLLNFCKQYGKEWEILES